MSETQTALASTTDVSARGISNAVVARNQHPSQTTKDLVAAVKAFNDSPPFQFTSALIDETEQLKQKLREKDDELQRRRAVHESCLVSFREDGARRDREATQQDDRIKALESTIAEHKQRVTRLQSTEQRLSAQRREISGALDIEKNNTAAGQRRISELKELFANQQEQTEELKKRLETAEVGRKSAESSYRIQKDISSELRRTLNDTDSELGALKNLADKLKEEGPDQIASRLSNLWQPALDLMKDYIGQDLDDIVLQDHYAWTNIDRYRSPIVVPRSNSYTAKLMRISVVMSILGTSIHMQIFQPTYLLPESSGIREFLFDHAFTDPARESLVRGVLLAMSRDRQKTIGVDRVTNTVNDAMGYVRDILPVNQREDFVEKLKRVVAGIQKVWDDVKSLKSMVEPIFDFCVDNFEIEGLEARLQLTGSEEAHEDHNLIEEEKEVPFLILPGIFTVANGQVVQITPGTVLTESRVTEAKQEMESRTAGSTQRALTSRRRPSVQRERPLILGGRHKNRAAAGEIQHFLG